MSVLWKRASTWEIEDRAWGVYRRRMSVQRGRLPKSDMPN